jgi:GDP-4-dehydro-6-deoxy-D-mannose reductase
VLERLLQLAEVDARIVRDSTRLRASEQHRMRGSYAKLRPDPGWEPSIGLDQSLGDLLQGWEERLS